MDTVSIEGLLKSVGKKVSWYGSSGFMKEWDGLPYVEVTLEGVLLGVELLPGDVIGLHKSGRRFNYRQVDDSFPKAEDFEPYGRQD